MQRNKELMTKLLATKKNLSFNIANLLCQYLILVNVTKPQRFSSSIVKSNQPEVVIAQWKLLISKSNGNMEIASAIFTGTIKICLFIMKPRPSPYQREIPLCDKRGNLKLKLLK
jgi:hypothetical protein